MFFNDLSQFSNNIAAIEGSEQLTYEQLHIAQARLATTIKELIGESGQVIVIEAHNGISTLIAYLAVLNTQHCAILVEPAKHAGSLNTIIEKFAVDLVIRCSADRQIKTEVVTHAQQSLVINKAAMLLTTSGSTGTAKHVVLSQDNLQANADSICTYLPIKPSDKTLCSLPFYYSYGLSVINTHLSAGACCVFTSANPISKEFWHLLDAHKINSIAGVPFIYEMLLRLKLTEKQLPHLRYLTQAGGKLAPEKIKALGQYAKDKDKQFFVMYGQTEATARMAFLAPQKVLDKPESIGNAIADGEFKLVSDVGQPIFEPNIPGELYYQGPNVMLGYADSREALATLDSENLTGSWLATGDMAIVDNDGDFTIVGRKSRFVKFSGQRIDLDSVEDLLSNKSRQVICTGDDTQLIVGLVDDKLASDQNDVVTQLHQQLGIHPSKVRAVSIASVPINKNGKTDYPALRLLAQGLSQ